MTVKRTIKQTGFHVILMKTLNEFLKISEKFRKETNATEKEKLGKKFNVLSVKVEQAIKNYDVKKLKFTTYDKNGNLVYVKKL